MRWPADLETARQAAATGSPALCAFGWVLYAAARQGNLNRANLANKGITAYCRRVLAG